MKTYRVGVLALQGAFAKHISMLQKLGAKTVEVRKPSELRTCDALVIPGGESTTMMKQMNFIEFTEAFRDFSKNKPVFGTCAGLILMSREIIADSMKPFDLLNISIERNAFGRQAESFRSDINVSLESGKTHPFSGVFIRAPRIRQCGPEVKILGYFEEEPVLVQQGPYLGATFHPELTSDTFIHAYFLKMISKS